MILHHYFFKSQGITLFDTLIVAVLSVFIVTLLKQTAILIWKVILSIYKLVKHIIMVSIPKSIKRIKERHYYRQNLKSGDISFLLYAALAKKNDQGVISRLEKKAFNVNQDKYQKAYEDLLGLDFKNIILNNNNYPKL